jgi:hypothetical protein
MIIIYPMITSPDIDKKILPGICKTLEKFILIYKMDEIFKLHRSGILSSVASGNPFQVASTVIQKTVGEEIEYALSDDNFISEAKYDPFDDDDRPDVPGFDDDDDDDDYEFDKNYQNKKSDKNKSKNPTKEVKQTRSNNTDSKVQVNQPDQDSLSLEPTYVNISTKSGTYLIGVKVLPFPTNRNISLADLVNNDLNLKKWQYITHKYYRKFMRVFYKVIRSLKVPFIRNTALTGDPKKDLFFASTNSRDNLFVLLNYIDLKNDALMQDMRKVRKLQGLSWGSFIVADDINKRAMFCMKEFKNGLCNIIPYTYIFSSFRNKGKGYYDVYKDMEDLKSKSGPFFNARKTNIQKMVGEAYTDSKLIEYSNLKENQNNDPNFNLINEEFMISEGSFGDFFSNIMKNLNLKKTTNDLEKAVEDKNSDSMMKTIKSLPKLSYEKIQSYASSFSEKYKKNYTLSEKVISNSTDSPEKTKKAAAMITALSASLKNKNIKESDIKEEIKETVEVMRRMHQANNEDKNKIKQEWGIPIPKYFKVWWKNPDSFNTAILYYILKIKMYKMKTRIIQGGSLMKMALKDGSKLIFGNVPTYAIVIGFVVLALLIIAWQVDKA